MSVFIVLAALGLLMLAAYRGYSVILFAPLAALAAVLVTDPALVAPLFTGLFMEKMAAFIKLYFPVFILGAIFGKLMELSGLARCMVGAIMRVADRRQSVPVVVAICALLTYGGVSLFVVVFAVYPFAAELFRESGLPKRLLPATIALGAFTFTMDALPGTPQIQNLIPVPFFGTTVYAAPWLGCLGAAFILAGGLLYLRIRCRQALAAGEGYGTELLLEPAPAPVGPILHPAVAVLPLLMVGGVNKMLSVLIPRIYGESHSFLPMVVGHPAAVVQEISKVAAIWAVEGALLAGIATVMVLAWKRVTARFAEGSRAAIGGALLASMNTASEYGFGAVIAALPGFLMVAQALKRIPHPLLQEAVTVTALAGVTGSASGGLSIALAAMAETFLQNARSVGIPSEVLHRVAAMASGGLDTLPHNGAVITLLSVTGLTHRQAYGDIFAITCIKTLAVFVIIGLYQLTGLV